MSVSLPRGTEEVALDEYLQPVGDDLAAALVETHRTLLVNVDDVVLPGALAQAIGRIVVDVIVNGLKEVVGGGAGTVQIACGVDRDGGLILEISDEAPNGPENLGAFQRKLDATSVPALVSQLGAHMAVEHADKVLRCTIVIPANAAS